MKNMKKIIALFLTLTMTLAMGLTAMAAGDGSITINNATPGKEYAVYKVFDATYSGEDNTAYTYKTTGTVGDDGTVTGDELYTALKGSADKPSPFVLASSTTAGVFNVSLNKEYATNSDSSKREATGAEIATWFQSLIPEGGTIANVLGAAKYTVMPSKESGTTYPDGVTVSNNGTNIRFGNLDYGYYYITSSLDTAVTIDSATPDVTVQDKNQQPGTDDGVYKSILNDDGTLIGTGTDSTVNYGDTVSYMLHAVATNYDGEKQIKDYVAHDIMGAGLENFTVTRIEIVNVDASTENAENSEDIYRVAGYNGDSDTGIGALNETTGVITNENTTVATINKNATHGTAPAPVESCTEITINWADESNGVWTSRYGANSIIRIYCEATVGENATIGKPDAGENSNLTNEGWFDWHDLDNEPGNPEGREESTTVTSYTYAIAINKTDASGNGLAGAEFEISLGNARIPVKAVEGQAGVYVYDSTDYTAGGTPNYTVVSPAVDNDGNSLILIKGLAAVPVSDGAGNEMPTYTVKETKAPDGYNLLTDTIGIKATAMTQSTTITTIYYDENNNIVDQNDAARTETITTDVKAAAVDVINNTGSELPSTGGMGTTVFYILGAILVIGAGVLLIVRRRMSAER